MKGWGQEGGRKISGTGGRREIINKIHETFKRSSYQFLYSAVLIYVDVSWAFCDFLSLVDKRNSKTKIEKRCYRAVLTQRANTKKEIQKSILRLTWGTESNQILEQSVNFRATPHTWCRCLWRPLTVLLVAVWIQLICSIAVRSWSVQTEMHVQRSDFKPPPAVWIWFAQIAFHFHSSLFLLLRLLEIRDKKKNWSGLKVWTQPLLSSAFQKRKPTDSLLNWLSDLHQSLPHLDSQPHVTIWP